MGFCCFCGLVNWFSLVVFLFFGVLFRVYLLMCLCVVGGLDLICVLVVLFAYRFEFSVNLLVVALLRWLLSMLVDLFAYIS